MRHYVEIQHTIYLSEILFYSDDQQIKSDGKVFNQNHENKIMNASGSWRCSFCLSFLLSFDSFNILFSRRSLALLESDIPLLLFKHSYKSFVKSQKNLLFCILVFINQLA